MAKNLNSWESDKLLASEASGPQKNLKMGLGGNFTFCGYGVELLDVRHTIVYKDYTEQLCLDHFFECSFENFKLRESDVQLFAFCSK